MEVADPGEEWDWNNAGKRIWVRNEWGNGVELREREVRPGDLDCRHHCFHELMKCIILSGVQRRNRKQSTCETKVATKFILFLVRPYRSLSTDVALSH